MQFFFWSLPLSVSDERGKIYGAFCLATDQSLLYNIYSSDHTDCAVFFALLHEPDEEFVIQTQSLLCVQYLPSSSLLITSHEKALLHTMLYEIFTDMVLLMDQSAWSLRDAQPVSLWVSGGAGASSECSSIHVGGWWLGTQECWSILK